MTTHFRSAIGSFGLVAVILWLVIFINSSLIYFYQRTDRERKMINMPAYLQFAPPKPKILAWSEYKATVFLARTSLAFLAVAFLLVLECAIKWQENLKSWLSFPRQLPNNLCLKWKHVMFALSSARATRQSVIWSSACHTLIIRLK